MQAWLKANRETQTNHKFYNKRSLSIDDEPYQETTQEQYNLYSSTVNTVGTANVTSFNNHSLKSSNYSPTSLNNKSSTISPLKANKYSKIKEIP